MNANQPKVTIVMATFNRPIMLRRAIESILRQTFSEWECIIVDNVSDDDTRIVLQEFAAHDARIIPLRNEKPRYLSESLERGVHMARGKYLARLDDDDYWIDDDKLKKQAAFLDAHPECVVVGGGMVIVDAAGREISRYFKKETDEEIRKTALFANPFSHTTVMFRVDAARRVGGYGAERYAEDWDLWLRMGTVGKFHNLQEYLTAYTVHGNNESFLRQRPHTGKVLRLIWKYRNDYPGFLRAYILNLVQYIYSFSPRFLRKFLQAHLAVWKRRSF